MADSEQIRQQIKSPAPLSTWFGVVLLLFLFGAIAVAIIGPAPRGDTYEQKRTQDREKKLKDLRDEDAKALMSYAWIDKSKGTVRVPIERAMELVVTDLANKKPAPAYVIATPAPESSAAPAGSAVVSPAPSTSPQPNGTPKPTSVAGQNSEAHGQPAAAVNPPAASPSTAPSASPAGSPLPVRGATAAPSP